jgi:divinyl protochlorophyllide a 8-vinyl-reductase
MPRCARRCRLTKQPPWRVPPAAPRPTACWATASRSRCSGCFSATLPRGVRPLVLEIRDNPLCRGLRAGVPACDYYAATFERLFQVLVHGDTQVRETACEACGDDACRFELRW